MDEAKRMRSMGHSLERVVVARGSPANTASGAEAVPPRPGEPTIFALSSGRPPAGIAVVRLTGSRAGAALAGLVKRLPAARRASLRRLYDPKEGGLLDRAVVLWLPGPHTQTGEDMAELHLHGGRAVVAAVLGVLESMDGLRLAEPGEFTRRAFVNGRLDLTEVEGLADLIKAETEAQRRQALRQFQGELRSKAEGWRGRLIEAMALIEAGIDFADEGDVPDDLVGPALTICRQLRDEIARALADGGRGERLREGLSVAVAGPPNAGKSSLFNRIARREAAIVSPLEGTTRDVIEVALDLEGYPVGLLDTAGVRRARNPVEREGVRRARARAELADLVLWVVDAGAEPAATARWRRRGSGELWWVWNKIDLLAAQEQARQARPVPAAARSFAVSTLTGEGLDGLLGALCGFAREACGGVEPSMVTRARQRGSLEQALEGLGRAIAQGPAGEIAQIAEDLRLSARALGTLTGRVDVEEVLDVIFRDFCIGK